ncbi:MAG: LTA synthase family protein [Eubacterium sp.]|nr:LTA synthase family protein [Eubacterium sp.]
MIHLLFLMISFGALLIILMPSTFSGIICSFAIFVLGVGLIIIKKVHRTVYWKNKQYLFLPITIVNAYLGFIFYNRWLPSGKIRSIAGRIHLPAETMLLVISLVFSLLSVYFLFAGVQILSEKISQSSHFTKDMVSCFISSFVTVSLAQIMIGVGPLSMGWLKLFWGFLIVSLSILLLYCIFGRIIPSVLIGTGLFMVISTINVYVFKFRVRLFEPVDILSFGTAMNVAENYSLIPIPFSLFMGWGIFLVMMIILYHLRRKSGVILSVKMRFVLLISCVIGTLAVFLYAANLKTYHWDREGAKYNGYVLDFVSKFKEITVSKPENYSTELIAGIADKYKCFKPETEPAKHPHIITIMDESFSDLSILGKVSTDTEVMPFISSLKANTISGYALASVYGGNTANSEYEYLTGNSMAGFSPNVVPYQQYVRSPIYSMVSYLKSSYNYNCIAMHPFLENGWNRPVAYKFLGFDKCFFIDDFPQKKFVREYVSDQEMFEFLIKTFEEEKDQPLFAFGVTMQNHGGYSYDGKNYSPQVKLNNLNDDYPEVEQYLSLIHETDKAVKYLITYFENSEEDVIIVFFGDHQPKLSDSFYNAIGKRTSETLDEQQQLYKVPFFIWANYEIEEKYVDCTSLNYLSSYVYSAAGIPLPPYNQFLQEMEGIIPSMNANGFFSPTAGNYLPFDEASGKELKWLRQYEALKYNNIFDVKHRNEKLFPVLE